METKVLQPAHKMTTAQCVIECSGYLRTIASQEFEGEDWQTAPKLRRQNLLTDFLCNLELSGEEFAELCGLIGFQLSKTTTAKLAKFTVIAYDWQSEANGEATADILAALDKCEGVALIEERGYHPQARTYDYLRFHIAAFWRCLVNELRSLCLGVGLVVYPKEIPATPTETPRISTETAEIVNVSVEGDNAENEPQKHISEVLKEAERNYQCVKSETLRTVREEDGKWHTYFMDDEIGTDLAYNQINHIPSARAAQAAEEVAEIRRYLNRLNGNHIADADFYLAEMREGIRQAEAARRKKNADAEGDNTAERAENAPKRKIQYFHYTPEQLKRYIIDVYEKNANGEWVLLPYAQIDTDAGLWDVVDGKIGWWTNWRREEFSEMNMDFNSPTCGRCCKINRTYQQDYFIVSNEKLLEFTINGNYYYIQKQTYSKGKHRWCYTIMDAYGDFAVDDFSYTKRGIMQRFNKWWKKNATIIWQASETPTEPSQSPETPQTVECATDAPKPRENAA